MPLTQQTLAVPDVAFDVVWVLAAEHFREIGLPMLGPKLTHLPAVPAGATIPRLRFGLDAGQWVFIHDLSTVTIVDP